MPDEEPSAEELLQYKAQVDPWQTRLKATSGGLLPYCGRCLSVCPAGAQPGPTEAATEMTPPDNSATSQIAQWASRQLADYDARDPGTLFAEGIVLDVDQGYRLQDAVARLRGRRGERVIGYKVGCTSPAIRRSLGSIIASAAGCTIRSSIRPAPCFRDRLSQTLPSRANWRWS